MEGNEDYEEENKEGVDDEETEVKKSVYNT
jgi:hypothetical protein